MSVYLLDTNHASPLVTFDHPLRQRVLREMDAGAMFGMSVVALTETLFGIGLTPRVVQNLTLWSLVQPQITIYDLDMSDAYRASELQVSLRKRGRQLATVDALIAVTALRYDLTLLTVDRDFDSVPDLRCENWIGSLS